MFSASEMFVNRSEWSKWSRISLKPSKPYQKKEQPTNKNKTTMNVQPLHGSHKTKHRRSLYLHFGHIISDRSDTRNPFSNWYYTRFHVCVFGTAIETRLNNMARHGCFGPTLRCARGNERKKKTVCVVEFCFASRSCKMRWAKQTFILVCCCCKVRGRLRRVRLPYELKRFECAENEKRQQMVVEQRYYGVYTTLEEWKRIYG